jgi:peptide chain release factor 1
VREGRRRRRIGVVVGRHIDGLHGRDRSALCRSNAFLQFANFSVQVGLVPHGRRHAAQQGRNFGTCLNEPENVVDEEEHVEMLLVAEIFRYGQAGKADAKPRAGRFSHLSVDQGGARFLRIAGNDDARFRHFQPKVVAFARALTHAGENGHAAVLHGDVVDQFHNEYGFSNARAAEKSNLSAFQIGLDEIDDLDAGFKHF